MAAPCSASPAVVVSAPVEVAQPAKAPPAEPAQPAAPEVGAPAVPACGCRSSACRSGTACQSACCRTCSTRCTRKRLRLCGLYAPSAVKEAKPAEESTKPEEKKAEALPSEKEESKKTRLTSMRHLCGIKQVGKDTSRWCYNILSTMQGRSWRWPYLRFDILLS